MGCHARSSDSARPARPPNEWLIYMYICVSSDIPREPPELSSSSLPGWGPKLSRHLWGCLMEPLPLCLLIHSSPTPIKTGPTFPLGPKFGRSWPSTPYHACPLASPDPELCALSGPRLGVRDAAFWPDVGLIFLPQVCLSCSCGCRDLIYREGPVATATPATAVLYSPHIWGSLPWQETLLVSHFPSPLLWLRTGLKGQKEEGCSPRSGA